MIVEILKRMERKYLTQEQINAIYAVVCLLRDEVKTDRAVACSTELGYILDEEIVRSLNRPANEIKC